MNSIIKTEIIKGKHLSLVKNCEDVYRIYYGNHEVTNDLDKEEVEYVYELTKSGYNWEKKIEDEN